MTARTDDLVCRYLRQYEKAYIRALSCFERFERTGLRGYRILAMRAFQRADVAASRARDIKDNSTSNKGEI